MAQLKLGSTINGKEIAIKDDIKVTSVNDQTGDVVIEANNYIHPSAHPASMITESSTRRFVTDAEKTTWSGKQDSLTAGTNVTINSSNQISATDTKYNLVTTSANGLMSSADKTKLNGIEAQAQKNVPVTVNTITALGFKQQIILDSEGAYDVLSTEQKNDTTKLYFIKG